MITFLRKTFIKDYENVNNRVVRQKHGALAAIGGMIVNILLFSFKLFIGIFTASIAIISDAINNLTDLFSCFVNLFGFKMAAKPADKEHPFGHQRIEYIVALIISLIVTLVAVVIAYQSVLKLVNQEKDITINFWVFIILSVSIVMKVILGLFYNGLGKAINSITMKATKQDSFNDAIITSGVLVSSIIIYFNQSVWWLDPIVSLLISIFILYTGIKLIIESSSPLISQTPDEQLIQKICSDISKHKVVLGIHDMICHMYGSESIFISIHVEVDGYSDFMKTHDEIDEIEDEIKEKYGIMLIMHIDPIDTKNPEIPILKEKIKDIIDAMNPSITFHEIRMTNKNNKTIIRFDVVIPNNLTDKTNELILSIKSQVEKLNSNYQVNIKKEDNYL